MLMMVMVKSGWESSERGKGLIVCMETEVFEIRPKNIQESGGGLEV